MPALKDMDTGTLNSFSQTSAADASVATFSRQFLDNASHESEKLLKVPVSMSFSAGTDSAGGISPRKNVSLHMMEREMSDPEDSMYTAVGPTDFVDEQISPGPSEAVAPHNSVSVAGNQ